MCAWSDDLSPTHSLTQHSSIPLFSFHPDQQAHTHIKWWIPMMNILQRSSKVTHSLLTRHHALWTTRKWNITHTHTNTPPRECICKKLLIMEHRIMRHGSWVDWLGCRNIFNGQRWEQQVGVKWQWTVMSALCWVVVVDVAEGWC